MNTPKKILTFCALGLAIWGMQPRFSHASPGSLFLRAAESKWFHSFWTETSVGREMYELLTSRMVKNAHDIDIDEILRYTKSAEASDIRDEIEFIGEQLHSAFATADRLELIFKAERGPHGHLLAEHEIRASITNEFIAGRVQLSAQEKGFAELLEFLRYRRKKLDEELIERGATQTYTQLRDELLKGDVATRTSFDEFIFNSQSLQDVMDVYNAGSKTKKIVAKADDLNVDDQMAVGLGLKRVFELPAEIRYGMEGGLLSKDVLVSFLKYHDRPVIGFVMRHGRSGSGAASALRSRLLADPKFVVSLLQEQAVGIAFTLAGAHQGRDDFWSELDFVFTDVVSISFADFSIVCILAPLPKYARSYKMANRGKMGTLLDGFSKTLFGKALPELPNNVFQKADFGEQLTLRNRLGSFVVSSQKFATVGTISAMAGASLTYGVMKAHQLIDPNYQPQSKSPEDILRYGALQGYFMGVAGPTGSVVPAPLGSSIFRYNSVAGLERTYAKAARKLADKILDPTSAIYSHRTLALKLVKGTEFGTRFATRFGNGVISQKLWLDHEKAWGVNVPAPKTEKKATPVSPQ